VDLKLIDRSKLNIQASFVPLPGP